MQPTFQKVSHARIHMVHSSENAVHIKLKLLCAMRTQFEASAKIKLILSNETETKKRSFNF